MVGRINDVLSTGNDASGFRCAYMTSDCISHEKESYDDRMTGKLVLWPRSRTVRTSTAHRS